MKRIVAFSYGTLCYLVFLATFVYAAFVATKARLSPKPTVGGGGAVSASTRSGRGGVPAPVGMRSE